MTGSTVEDILDAGAVGLIYFEKYLPIVHRVVPDSPWTYPGLCARYDQQRDLDLGVLTQDARVLGDAVGAANAEVEQQGALVEALTTAWVGPAAEQALAHIRSDRARGSAITDATGQLAQLCSATAEHIGVAIERKAADIALFDPTGSGSPERSLIDGIPLIGVEAIDALAQLNLRDNPLIDAHAQTFIDAVSPYLPAVVPPPATPASGVPLPSLLPKTPLGMSLETSLAHARAVCDDWLRNIFAPIVSAACQHVLDSCVATDTAVRDYLTTIAEFAEGVETCARPASSADPGAGGVDTRTEEVGGDSQPSDRTPDTSVGPAAVVPAAVGSSAVPADVQPPAEPARSDQPGSGGQTPGPSSGPPPPTEPADLLPALESVFGDLPSGTDIVSTVERVGHELTSQVKAALDDLLDRLTGTGDPLEDHSPREDSPSADGARARSESEPDSRQSRGFSGPDTPSTPSPEPPSVPFLPAPPAPLPYGAADAERGHLEAALDGHSARLSLSHNGILALELGTPDGAARHFELRPGPFGLPVVEQVQGPAPSTQAPQSQSAPQPEPAPQSHSTPQPEPAQQLQSAPQPESAQPEPPAAVRTSEGEASGSGARLAEAGPL